MDRGAFLAGCGALTLALSRPPDLCTHNEVLPYNDPLELKMRVLDGPDFALSQYSGYVVWMNIFTTWCPPCQKEQAFVVKASIDGYDRGLRVIGIDCAEDDDVVRAYRKKYAIPYPIAMDQKGGFSYALESKTKLEFPAHIFITPSGYLDCYVVGEMSEQEITRKLDSMLAAPTPKPTSTPAPFI
ncbi:MAG: TlpA family protein disulfide reductase [Candidatus Eremiobacteraeota bacterium]|nr:TlpA family protein disulfide reductase [Candidatus Eremiobacteraeota bacterium]